MDNHDGIESRHLKSLEPGALAAALLYAPRAGNQRTDHSTRFPDSYLPHVRLCVYLLQEHPPPIILDHRVSHNAVENQLKWEGMPEGGNFFLRFSGLWEMLTSASHHVKRITIIDLVHVFCTSYI